jgi:hypothetical protein
LEDWGFLVVGLSVIDDDQLAVKGKGAAIPGLAILQSALPGFV